ncbi:DUF1266 domain-containing protein [Salmonella enterica subsp. enterica]|nr:DUF1266 domain-containing protein [Salmonella enterica subsp. enterica]
MTETVKCHTTEWLCRRWFRYAPQEWQESIPDALDEGDVFMPDLSLIPPCVAAKVVFSWDYVAWGFSAAWALNEWLTEEESLWLQSRYSRALSYYSGWLQYFSAYYTGRL